LLTNTDWKSFLLTSLSVRENLNGKSFAAFPAAGAQYSTAIFGRHTSTETVGSFSF
jgi:hypothetical protein